MPQPLSTLKNLGIVSIGNVGDRPLRQRPELALLVAEVIASWSNVESFHLNLFMNLLGGPGEKAADIYLALEARSSKSDAIRAAAKSLPEPHENLLLAILAISKSHQKARDKIAHWTWGVCTGIPDALLLASPKDMIISDHDFSKIFVYREEELKQIIKTNERLAGYGQTLGFIIMGHPANQENQLYDQLCAEPEIRDKLHQMSPPSPKPA